MRIPESELIINEDGSAFHIHLRPEELADNVILVGDPGRVDMVCEYFDNIECRHASREFVSATGWRNGKRLTVLSHGIGPDNIDIVMTELDALANIDFNTREVKAEHRALNILRVGTCGALQPEIPLGAYILSHVSIGFDGVLNWYGERDQFAMLDVEEAFKKHTGWNEKLASPYFIQASPKIIHLMQDCTIPGATISAMGFYGPQCRVVRLSLVIPDLIEKIESFRFKGYCITNFEMESAPLAGLAALLGHNAATVYCAIANRYQGNSNPNYKIQVRNLVELAVDRMSRL